MRAETLALAFALALIVLGAGGLIWNRISRRRMRSTEGSTPPEYFEALTALLDNRADRALELFLELADRDADTVELHFALGSLFRRKGEIERATRIHQNLIARPALSRTQRNLALKELGEDYMQVGLNDRAERIFSELLDRKRFQAFAARQLVAIYEQQQDWPQAAALRRRLEWITGVSERAVIAQYHCEMVEAALEREEDGAAREALREARRLGPDVVRVRLLVARLSSAEGDIRRAAREYRQLLDRDPEYAEIVLPVFAGLFPAGARSAEFQTLVRRILASSRRARIPVAVAGVKHPQLRIPEVLGAIEMELGKRIDPLMTDEPSLLESHDVRVALMRLLTRWVEQRPLYQCDSCGFSARVLYWHCPGCRSWGSMHLKQDIFPELGSDHVTHGLPRPGL